MAAATSSDEAQSAGPVVMAVGYLRRRLESLVTNFATSSRPVSLAVLGAFMALATAVVYWTGGTPLAWMHLYYIPVVLAGIRFDVPGGVIAGLMAGALCGPLLPVPASWGVLEPLVSWVFRTLSFVLVGAITGLIGNLQQLALRDGLTRLYNRAYFRERLEKEISRAQRTKAPLCLVMLDIDHFKHYNDINGHIAGDHALIKVGQLIRRNTRSTDCAARYGGEEFAIILVGCSLDNAVRICNRLLGHVREAGIAHAENQPLGFFSASVGVAEYRPGEDTPLSLIERADEALYRAKQKRACVAA